MATATFELALPDGYTQEGGKLVPSGLSYDGTDYSGNDGTYDVYEVSSTGEWTYEEVVLEEAVEPDPDPVDESATATFTLAAPAGHSTTTLATDFDPYIFQGWDTQPSVGDQLVYATADNTSITSNADMETDATGEVDIYHVGSTGLWTYAPINYANLPVAETATAPTEAPVIGTITVTETTASIPFSTVTDATGYEYSTNGTDWTDVASPLSLDTLDPETAYSGEIRAKNAEGPGPSATYSFTTEAAPLAPPTGTVTFGTPTTGTTTASLTTSYDGDDAISFEYRINDGPWITYTSPITLADLTAETTYAIDASAVNGDGRGTIFSTTVTTEAGSAVPLERTYTLTAGIDELPKAQQFTIYQGERVRFNVTHDIDMTGRVMIMRVAPALGSPSKLSVNAGQDSFLMTSEMTESLDPANKVWQILIKEGNQRVVVADGTSIVKQRIKEPQ